ncbi:ComF family protein [Helicobacter muridarum]|uniref:ComF family protein n=1 Tax=Helicobacter muridarum TaxID=216 RepID=A0A099U2E9_9HELI|nr:ComF family protein [Helicobacter muridarum]TLE01692.1 ComF family protein [Helicobacter muridarum]STQ86332.1 purine/pyrimidine phosphoribosyltransferase [Helicobacter muridarum]
MYCSICNRLSFSIICKLCIDSLWRIESKRELDNGLRVFSSFAFSELRGLIHTKYNVIGSRIFRRLGEIAIKEFFISYNDLLGLDRNQVGIVCVRNMRIGLYSHSAILARCFKSFGFRVFHNVLKTGNDIRFMQLNLRQRKSVSRNFLFHAKILRNISAVILVDDLITTGQTLLEASNVIESNGIKVLCAWTLCDTRF